MLAEVPAGRAAAKEDGTTVIYEFNAEVTAADVKASVPCPPNHYCLAGNPEAASGANGLPQRCPDNKISPEGSDDVTDCVLGELHCCQHDGCRLLSNVTCCSVSKQSRFMLVKFLSFHGTEY